MYTIAGRWRSATPSRGNTWPSIPLVRDRQLRRPAAVGSTSDETADAYISCSAAAGFSAMIAFSNAHAKAYSSRDTRQYGEEYRRQALMSRFSIAGKLLTARFLATIR